MTTSDWIQVGVFIVGLTTSVAILKNDIKWLGRRIDDHQKSDDKEFARLDKELRSLRHDRFLGEK